MFSRFILVCLILFNINSSAQDNSAKYSISGQVILQPSGSLAGGSVQLINPANSSVIRNTVADSVGRFFIPGIDKGRYVVRVSHIGYKTHTTEILELSSNTLLPPIQLVINQTTLAEISVVARTPVVEQQLNKTVINVESNIAMAGASVLDVLEKSPGIMVNQSGAISVRGKQGVLVMINGKQVQLPANELAEMLRGVSASSVQRVEIINNPSAKYDASGNAGVIDIKLKKSKQAGVNGNIALNGGSGKFVKSNNGGNINYRTKKLAVFANYNYAYRLDFVDYNIERDFSVPVNSTKYSVQNYYQDVTYGAHTSRATLEYQLTKKSTLGSEVFGNFINIDRSTDSKTALFNQQNAGNGNLLMLNSTTNGRRNLGVNLNYQLKLDTSGTVLSVDADAAKYKLDDVQYYNFGNKNPLGQQGSPLLLFAKADGDLNIRSASVNFETNLARGRLEAGVKASHINSFTNINFYNQSTGDDIFDQEFSNRFTYKENIQAAYVDFSRKIKNINYQLGLRVENTEASGFDRAGSSNFKRSYHQFFPSGAFSYQINNTHAIGLNFSRRITRPAYNQVNPYFYFIDPNTRFTGNQGLAPTLTYSVDLNYTLLGKYIFSLNYFKADNPIIEVQRLQAQSNNIIIHRPENIGTNSGYSLVVTVPFKVYNWFNSANTLSGFYSRNNGVLDGERISNSRPYINGYSNNSFIIDKWTAQLVGSYTGTQYAGNVKISPIMIMTFGLQRKLMNNKLTLGFTLNDMLNDNNLKTSSSFGNLNSRSLWRRDSRTILFNLNYKFGGNGQATKRKTGSADDEKRRAG